MAYADAGTGRTVRPINAGLQTLLILAGTVKIGDLIGFSTGWKRADGDTGPIKANFIAMGNGDSGDVIPVCTEAEVDGFTGGTDGGLLYLSGTAGRYTDSQIGGLDAIGVQVSATAAVVRTNPILR